MIRTRSLLVASFLVGAVAGAVLLPRASLKPALASKPAPSPLLRSETAKTQQRGRMSTERTGPEINTRVTPVVRAVQVAGPSVVNIQVGELRQLRDGKPVFVKRGEASGVIVEEEGLVISNWHVVRDHVRPNFYCRISLRNGEVYEGRVLSSSHENDLALLVIEPKDGKERRFPPIQLGNSDQLMVGETVVAIGNPHGQVNTVTAGVLSATHRSLRIHPRGEPEPIVFEGLLQTDAAINPGNSGGALLDITGRLIGINTLTQKASENIGFAIPVNRVKEVFQSNLLRYDSIDRFWTGLRVEEHSKGVRIANVTQGGPAWRAGLRHGDRITSIGGKALAGLQDFGRALIRREAGDKIPLEILRGQTKHQLTLVPWGRTNSRIYMRAGMLVEALRTNRNKALLKSAHETFYGRNHYWPALLTPLRVTMLQRGGPAEQLGLQEGDLILGVKQRHSWTGFEGRKPLTGGESEFVEILDLYRGQSLPLLVYRPGKPLQSGPLDVR